MIIVKKFEDFQKFVDMLEAKELPYSIAGYERDGTYGSVKKSGKADIYTFSYMLMSSICNVYIRSYVDIRDKKRVTDCSAKYDLLEFERMYIEEKDGNVYCGN